MIMKLRKTAQTAANTEEMHQDRVVIFTQVAIICMKEKARD